ncbi:hypothetical protein PENTCL1PPCAC_9877, partial [Pristionchus entomophagus]
PARRAAQRPIDHQPLTVHKIVPIQPKIVPQSPTLTPSPATYSNQGCTTPQPAGVKYCNVVFPQIGGFAELIQFFPVSNSDSSSATEEHLFSMTSDDEDELSTPSSHISSRSLSRKSSRYTLSIYSSSSSSECSKYFDAVDLDDVSVEKMFQKDDVSCYLRRFRPVEERQNIFSVPEDDVNPLLFVSVWRSQSDICALSNNEIDNYVVNHMQLNFTAKHIAVC